MRLLPVVPSPIRGWKSSPSNISLASYFSFHNQPKQGISRTSHDMVKIKVQLEESLLAQVKSMSRKMAPLPLTKRGS